MFQSAEKSPPVGRTLLPGGGETCVERWRSAWEDSWMECSDTVDLVRASAASLVFHFRCACGHRR